jgi:hypothetical protein
VGKTSLAAEYAHRHLAELGVAWLVRCEEAAVLVSDLAELAAQVGGRELADPRDPVASAHAVLAAFGSPWLLIFDNAVDEPSIRRLVPPAGLGRVVVTSQSQHWPGWQVLDVPVLDPAVAARFLVNRAADQDQAAAAALATELGGLPLALEQAAAYVQATAGTLAGYLGLFRQRRADLLARGTAAGHPVSVAATLGVALARLEADAPAAAGVLRLLAFLAAEPVPLALVLSDADRAEGLDPEVAAVIGPLLGDPVAAGDAVAALRAYSLVTPAGGGMVQTHRLVQAVTLDQMPAGQADQWRAAAATLTEAAIPADPRLPETWPLCAMLMPHAQAVLDLTSDGMSRIAAFAGEQGAYPVARDLYQQIAQAYEHAEAYGPEHCDTLTARHQLATYTGQAGDPARARDLLAELLPVRERTLGAEHLHTLTSRHNLATFTGDAGDPARARSLLAELLPVRERILGAEHPDTLTTRHQLATYTGQAGDPARARDLLAELLPVRERIQGAEHPHTLTGRHEFATYTGQAGDPAQARDLLARLLPDMQQVLGAEHPSTLRARHQLASFTGLAGDPAQARDLLAGLLPVRERVLGAEHPDTLSTRHQLATFTGQAGDPPRARDLLAELLPVRERIQGAEHPDTLAARHEFAHYTGLAGDSAQARDLLAELLPMRQRVLGAEHPDTLTGRHALATYTGQAGDSAQARDLLAELLPMRERVQGAEHPDALACRHNLATFTGQAGDPARARDLFAGLLPDMERALGAEHPSTLTTRRNLDHWTQEAAKQGSGQRRS